MDVIDPAFMTCLTCLARPVITAANAIKAVCVHGTAFFLAGVTVDGPVSAGANKVPADE